MALERVLSLTKEKKNDFIFNKERGIEREREDSFFQISPENLFSKEKAKVIEVIFTLYTISCSSHNPVPVKITSLFQSNEGKCQLREKHFYCMLCYLRLSLNQQVLWPDIIVIILAALANLVIIAGKVVCQIKSFSAQTLSLTLLWNSPIMSRAYIVNLKS